MNLTLEIWRQKDAKSKGKFVTYQLTGASEEMSFLEMLDYFNKTLIEKGDSPVAFEYDCREGICGTCGLYINGYAHGPASLTTTCELADVQVQRWRQNRDRTLALPCIPHNQRPDR
jgi:succinate dehydrogenase / fumarate reductase, iron-sulfur subunit